MYNNKTTTSYFFFSFRNVDIADYRSPLIRDVKEGYFINELFVVVPRIDNWSFLFFTMRLVIIFFTSYVYEEA